MKYSCKRRRYKIDVSGNDAELYYSSCTLAKWTDWQECADYDFVCRELDQLNSEMTTL
jgi:hypothetical protein